MKIDLVEKIKAADQQDAIKSAGVTMAIGLVFFLVVQIWNAKLFTVPQMGMMDKDKYEVIAVISSSSGGTMDYGTDWKGSGNENSYEDPSPTPGIGEKGSTAPLANRDVAKETKTENQTKPVLTQDKPSPIKSPAESGDKNSEATSKDPKGLDSGSNHGNTDVVGNWGRPDAQLNPNANFSWGKGDGTGGLGGRRWVALPDPVYTVNETSKITFEFTIGTDGTVKSVARPIGGNSELIAAGMAAIYKWTFEPVDEEKGSQKVKVTMTFKLE
jgi:hypothetical protein